ncbi:MAG TPA: hypothetical protein VIW21_03855 [Chthoniobacterales bacterium]
MPGEEETTAEVKRTDHRLSNQCRGLHRVRISRVDESRTDLRRSPSRMLRLYNGSRVGQVRRRHGRALKEGEAQRVARSLLQGNEKMKTLLLF